MSKKVTWDVICADFKRRHPRLRKEITYWRPYDFATILITFKDGSVGTYNYDEHRLTYRAETWMYK